MEDNTSFESQKYADVSLSEAEQKMQKFLEESYGLSRDEYCSIVLWLDNFSLRFDDIERFENIEDSLSKDFNLTPNDIFGILFSHGDIFCNDYSKTQGEFEFLKQRYSFSKKDFADMLKAGCVIDKDIIKEIETSLKNRYPDKKWIPMPKILKNVIEYANVDYPAEIAYKIDLLGKFGVSFDDLNGKFEFLKLPISDLLTRLKLMNLTNELPHSFLNVGHRTPNSRVYKLFLKFQADDILKKKGYNNDYVDMKKKAESVVETEPLSQEQIKYIDDSFARRFKNIHTAILSLKVPEPKVSQTNSVQVGPANFEPIEEPVVSEPKIEPVVSQEKKVEVASSDAPVVDFIESGKQLSYVKNSVGAQVKKTEQGAVKGGFQFVKIDPAYKYVWTYMVKNFGLTYGEYPEVVERLNADRRNRLKEKTSDIEAVFSDISKDFVLTKQDFGKFFKYTLYGMAQRLALLECFGVIPQDLAKNNYANIPILDWVMTNLNICLKLHQLERLILMKTLEECQNITRIHSLQNI